MLYSKMEVNQCKHTVRNLPKKDERAIIVGKKLEVLAILGVTISLCVASVGCTGAGAFLKSIAVSPEEVILPVDATQQLTVTATYTEGEPKNVTAECSYESSNVEIATITGGGFVKGIAPGSASITVSYPYGKQSRTVTIPVTVKQ